MINDISIIITIIVLIVRVIIIIMITWILSAQTEYEIKILVKLKLS